MAHLQPSGFKPSKHGFPSKALSLYVLVCDFPASLRWKFTLPTLPLTNEHCAEIMLQNAAVTKLIRIHFPKRRKSHQNLSVALPLCSARLGFFISVCRRPRVQTTGGPDDIWLPSSPGILAAVLISALFIKTDDARYSMLSAVQCVNGRELAEMPGVL